MSHLTSGLLSLAVGLGALAGGCTTACSLDTAADIILRDKPDVVNCGTTTPDVPYAEMERAYNCIINSRRGRLNFRWWGHPPMGPRDWGMVGVNVDGRYEQYLLIADNAGTVFQQVHPVTCPSDLRVQMGGMQTTGASGLHYIDVSCIQGGTGHPNTCSAPPTAPARVASGILTARPDSSRPPKA